MLVYQCIGVDPILGSLLSDPFYLECQKVHVILTQHYLSHKRRALAGCISNKQLIQLVLAAHDWLF